MGFIMSGQSNGMYIFLMPMPYTERQAGNRKNDKQKKGYILSPGFNNASI
jgi:hypothetical protein